MLKSCQYCGRIHDAALQCPERKAREAARYRTPTYARKIRSTAKWTACSLRVRERDHFLCLCCLAQLEGTVNRYETNELEVHHIIPIKDDETLRFDERNLITLCKAHHEMCEAGMIGRDKQRQLVEESIKSRGRMAY